MGEQISGVSEMRQCAARWLHIYYRLQIQREEASGTAVMRQAVRQIERKAGGRAGT